MTSSVAALHVSSNGVWPIGSQPNAFCNPEKLGGVVSGADADSTTKEKETAIAGSATTFPALIVSAYVLISI